MSRPVTVPVIAIDGPSGSGKGTVARLVARRLGWHLLDSGALYRLVALALQLGGSLASVGATASEETLELRGIGATRTMRVQLRRRHVAADRQV